MGILNRFFGKSNSTNEDKLALFLNLMSNLSGVDGNQSSEEVDFIQNYLSKMENNFTREKWERIVVKAQEIGSNAISQASKLAENEKSELLNALIGIAAADGYFAGAEYTWIMVFASALGLDVDKISNDIMDRYQVNLNEAETSMKSVIAMGQNALDGQNEIEADRNLIFERVIKKITELIGDDLFSVIACHIGVNQDEEIASQDQIGSVEHLISLFRKNFEGFHTLSSALAKNNGISEGEVLRQLVAVFVPDPDFKTWLEKSLDEKSKFLVITGILTLMDPSHLNDSAYDAYEDMDLKSGLSMTSLAVYLQSFWSTYLKILGLPDNNIEREYHRDLAGYLDTFALGLYLKESYQDSILIHNKSIELAPEDPRIAEHLTNRGKAKLMISDLSGAKLDFEKALEKDNDYQMAKDILASEQLKGAKDDRAWIDESDQKTQLLEYENVIHEFLEKMNDPRTAPWFDIIQKRGDSQYKSSEILGIKMEDFDYWADGHYQEYIPRIELDDNDHMKLDLEGLKLRVCIFSKINGGIRKVIDKAAELGLSITQETSNDFYAVQASIIGVQKALSYMGMHIECYDNGQVQEEYQIENGNHHGFFKRYHDNGELRVETRFKNGLQLDGEVVSYHDNGSKARVVNLVNQLKQGEYREWYPNGKLKLIGVYKDGESTIVESF